MDWCLPMFVMALVMIGTVSTHICTDQICEYTFVLRRWRTMTYTKGDATYNVRLNGTRLQVVENRHHLQVTDPFIGSFVGASDVITADGFTRDVITINNKFPGPNIEVMAGSQV